MMKIGPMALAPAALATVVLASSAFASSAFAASAPSENPFAQDQVLLQLGGLDLATVDGQRRLAIRMDAAARAVCGDRLASVHLAAEQKARECRAAVKADIRDRIEARMADAPDARGIGPEAGLPVRLASAR